MGRIVRDATTMEVSPTGTFSPETNSWGLVTSGIANKLTGSVRQNLGMGALTLVYMAGWFLVLFLYPSSVAVCVYGLGGTLFNPANAYVTWNWWRMWGAVVSLYIPALVGYCMYQERKSITAGPVSTLNRGTVRLIFGFTMVVLVLVGVFQVILTIWFGVADIGECTDSPACSGAVPSKTPEPGAIMVITGMGAMSVCTAVALLILTYIHMVVAQTVAAISTARLPFLANERTAEAGNVGAEMQPLAAAAAAPGTSLSLRAKEHAASSGLTICDAFDLADRVRRLKPGQVIFQDGHVVAAA